MKVKIYDTDKKLLHTLEDEHILLRNLHTQYRIKGDMYGTIINKHRNIVEDVVSVILDNIQDLSYKETPENLGHTIERIVFRDNDFICVGINDITSIVPVHRAGQMNDVVWFEVYKGDEKRSEWNAAHILGVEFSE